MTAALDAMVKAMADELKRQDDDWARYLDEHPWMKDEPAPGSEGYNLNHVARAGLIALRAPRMEITLAMEQQTGIEAPLPCAAMARAMIDKILE
jgi:hypothetical protein